MLTNQKVLTKDRVIILFDRLLNAGDEVKRFPENSNEAGDFYITEEGIIPAIETVNLPLTSKQNREIAEIREELKLELPCTAMDIYDWAVRNFNDNLNEDFAHTCELLKKGKSDSIEIDSSLFFVGWLNIDPINETDLKSVDNISSKKTVILEMVEPKRKRDWFYPIAACIKEFEERDKHTPSALVLWSRLISNPPVDYGIEYDNVNKSLKMEGVAPMDKKGFDNRYNKYYP